MTKTYAELGQELKDVQKIENPWERAVREQIIEIQSRIITEENEIEAHLKRIKDYANDYLTDAVEHYEPMLVNHKGMVAQRDQMLKELRMLEYIAENATTKS
jgi:hypothetical protein